MKVKIAIIIFWICFSLVKVYSGNTTDSLKNIINTTNNDSLKMATYMSLVYSYLNQPVRALEILSEMKIYCDKIKTEKTLALCLRRMGALYHKLNYFDKSLECTIKAAEIFEKIDDKEGLANCYNNIANSYTNKGELTGNKILIERAIEYHQKSINLRIEINDTAQLKNSYNNIALAYMSDNENEMALAYFTKAYRAYVTSDNDINGVDMITLNLGDVYLKMAVEEKKPEYFTKALFYFNNRLESYKDHGNTQRYATALTRAGQILCETGKCEKGMEYLKRAMEMCLKLNDRGSIKETSEQLARAYEKTGDFKKATEYMHIFNATKDSLLNKENETNMEQMQALYQSSQKDKEIEQLNSDKKLQDIELNRRRTIIFSTVGGLLLLMTLAFVLFSRYNLKKKANVQLTDAYEKIETKNRQITDSINYAKRIQNAILPLNESIEKHLDNFFIYYSPKDIVSGDFYWFSSHHKKTFFIVADCTGHGVPGALMSMIGNTLLNEIINQENIFDPGEILFHLNKGVTNALHQQGNELLTQDDGMDISVCCMDENDKSKIKYASANHTIFIKNKNSITELKGDIFSIGGSMANTDKQFVTKEIKVEKDSVVIMSTDGYYDQFGGSSDSKFLITRFEELILKTDFNNNNVSDEFKNAFENWQGECKQTDDVLVAGFKI